MHIFLICYAMVFFFLPFVVWFIEGQFFFIIVYTIWRPINEIWKKAWLLMVKSEGCILKNDWECISLFNLHHETLPEGIKGCNLLITTSFCYSVPDMAAALPRSDFTILSHRTNLSEQQIEEKHKDFILDFILRDFLQSKSSSIPSRMLIGRWKRLPLIYSPCLMRIEVTPWIFLSLWLLKLL